MDQDLESQISKKTTEVSPSAGGDQQYTNELSSQEDARKIDVDLHTFDTELQSRTSCAIITFASGVEVRSTSFDSLKDEIESLLAINQEVVKVIVKCKKNQELFELVEEYFDNSLQTLDFCAALEKCLDRARDSQSLIDVVLRQFEKETEVRGSRYVRTLEELKKFEAAGDPFTEEFFRMFQSVYKQRQVLMLEKLQLRKNKLNKKLKCINMWRKVSSMIFVITFAAVLICSVVVAAKVTKAGSRLAAVLAAFTSIPIGSLGKWVDSLWKNYEDALKWQRGVISSMQAGNKVAIKDLDNIRVLVDRLRIDIAALLQNADFAIQEEAVKIGIEEIKKKLGVFMKNARDLGAQADLCSSEIRQARTVVLQRIIKKPNN